MSRTKHKNRVVRGVFSDRQQRGFGDRLWELKSRYERDTGRELSQRELALKVSAKLKADRVYNTSTVSGWIANRFAPDTRVMNAIAEIFHCDPGWLAFGANTHAQSPEEEARTETRLDAVRGVVQTIQEQIGAGVQRHEGLPPSARDARTDVAKRKQPPSKRA